MTEILHPIKDGTQMMFLLENLQKTNSTLKKQAIVDNYIDAPLFREVCKWTLDPFITFGVTKWAAPHWHGPVEIKMNNSGELYPLCLHRLLSDLSARRLTGHKAQDEIVRVLEMLTPSSSELLERILGRSLKCKVTKTIINKAHPGLIPTFDVMRAYSYEEKRVTVFPTYVEEKLDGVRLICFVNFLKSSVKFFSRSGIPFTNLNHLNEGMLSLCELANAEIGITDPDKMIEWVFDDEIKAGAFNKTVGDIRRQKEQATDAICHVFDLLPKYHWDNNLPGGDDYEARSEMLFQMMYGKLFHQIVRVPTKKVFSHEEIMEEYHKVLARGGEGVIVKLADGPYERKKSLNWLKIKDKITVDVIVTDYYPGEKGKELEHTLGGLVGDLNGVTVRVGGGFSRALRDELWKALTEGIGESPIGRMMEASCHELTPTGAMRHGNFEGWRDDKHLPGDET